MLLRCLSLANGLPPSCSLHFFITQSRPPTEFACIPDGLRSSPETHLAAVSSERSMHITNPWLLELSTWLLRRELRRAPVDAFPGDSASFRLFAPPSRGGDHCRTATARSNGQGDSHGGGFSALRAELQCWAGPRESAGAPPFRLLPLALTSHSAAGSLAPWSNGRAEKNWHFEEAISPGQTV